MTKEQIDEMVLDAAALMVEPSEDELKRWFASFQRLRDEREALLAAAQQFRAAEAPCNDNVGTGCETGSWCNAHSAAAEALLAAIAKAEAP